ncbi:MAG: PqqD family peptide modification chaperone [Acidimicrobiia bacterium]
MTTITDDTNTGAPGVEPDAIDLSFVARLVPGLVVEDVHGERVVIGGPSQVMVLNPSAALVFQFLDGEGTLGELAADIADALDTDPDRVAEDVLEFARSLAWAGMLEGIEFPAPPDIDVDWDQGPGAGQGADVGDSLLEYGFTDFSGTERSLREFAGRKVMFVNWSPGCGFCTKIAGQLGAVETLLREEKVELVFLTAGDEESNTTVFDDAGSTAPVFLRAEGGADPFAGTGTPAAFVLDEQGVVAQPMLVGADQVPRLATDLAGIDSPDGSVPIDGVRYLPAPGAMCGPGGGGGGSNSTKWEGLRAYEFGEHHVGIKYDDADTAAILDRLFPGARVDDLRAPENYAVALGGTPTTKGAGASRSLKLLVQGSRQIVRSRSSARVLAGLLQHLTDDLAPRDSADPSLLRVYATPAVSDGRAVLLPAGLAEHVKQLQPRLAKVGATFVDTPSVWVDPVRGELVVPEPTVAFDAAVLDDVDRDVKLGAELPWVRPGRYPIGAWLVVRGPEEMGPLSPGIALTSTLGLVFGIETIERTVEVVGQLTTMTERVPVMGTWYENPTELADQVRAALR